MWSPKQIRSIYPNANLVSCEQTFAWLGSYYLSWNSLKNLSTHNSGRFKKILNQMGKVHHHFFLHCLVKRRNEYTTRLFEGKMYFSQYKFSPEIIQRAGGICLKMKTLVRQILRTSWLVELMEIITFSWIIWLSWIWFNFYSECINSVSAIVAVFVTNMNKFRWDQKGSTGWKLLQQGG